jgi:hypothetical protein
LKNEGYSSFSSSGLRGQNDGRLFYSKIGRCNDSDWRMKTDQIRMPEIVDILLSCIFQRTCGIRKDIYNRYERQKLRDSFFHVEYAKNVLACQDTGIPIQKHLALFASILNVAFIR